MDEDVHREVWQSLGTVDPDWAVLTEPGQKHGGWVDELDRFYGHGVDDVEHVLAALPDEPPLGHHRALDWGSGTGRLSFALAARFDRVTCVDISDSMLATLAQRADQRGVPNVDPVPLAQFAPAQDHDLVLSLLVLQHLPDRGRVREALTTMVAALRPGGVLFVEIPSRPRTGKARLQPKFQAYRLGRRLGIAPARLHRAGLSGISMLTVTEPWVRDVLERAGADLERVLPVHDDGNYDNLRYLARRRDSAGAQTS